MGDGKAKDFLKVEYRRLGFPDFANMVDAGEPSVHAKAAVAAIHAAYLAGHGDGFKDSYGNL